MNNAVKIGKPPEMDAYLKIRENENPITNTD